MAYRSPIFDSKGREVPSDIVEDHGRCRLDAAAPEMLAALKSLCDDDVTYDGSTILITCGTHRDAIERMRLARAAIAKAEGRP